MAWLGGAHQDSRFRRGLGGTMSPAYEVRTGPDFDFLFVFVCFLSDSVVSLKDESVVPVSIASLSFYLILVQAGVDQEN